VPLEVEGGEAFANAEWRWRFGADEQICCGLRSGWSGLRLGQRRLDLDSSTAPAPQEMRFAENRGCWDARRPTIEPPNYLNFHSRPPNTYFTHHHPPWPDLRMRLISLQKVWRKAVFNPCKASPHQGEGLCTKRNLTILLSRERTLLGRVRDRPVIIVRFPKERRRIASAALPARQGQLKHPPVQPVGCQLETSKSSSKEGAKFLFLV
jgi:hypothetical protein